MLLLIADTPPRQEPKVTDFEKTVVKKVESERCVAEMILFADNELSITVGALASTSQEVITRHIDPKHPDSEEIIKRLLERYKAPRDKENRSGTEVPDKR